MEGPTPEVLLSAEQIEARVHELAQEIAAADSRAPVVCIGVLKGATFFLVDLVRALPLASQIDFVQISSYRDGTRPGELEILKKPTSDLEGKRVLLVEDIVDSGRSVRALLELFSSCGAESVEVCTLLDKVSEREVEVPVHYRGFEIPNHFVVGYGLDYAERYRELPYVGVLPAEAAEG